MGLRILALATDVYGAGGGIAQYNRDLFQALSRCDNVDRIVVLTRNGNVATDSIPGKVHQLPARPGRLAFIYAAIGALKSQAPFDSIFCGHLYMAPLAALLSKATSTPLWLQLHGIEAWHRPKPLQRWAAERAQSITAVSRYTRRLFLGWARCSPETVKVLPNTVDERFSPGPKPDALLDRYGLRGKKVLLTVSRLAASEGYKGHDRVIRAVAELRSTYPDIAYVVAGDGDDRPRLEQMARELGVAEQVRFIGHVPDGELPDLYRAADAFHTPRIRHQRRRRHHHLWLQFPAPARRPGPRGPGDRRQRGHCGTRARPNGDRWRERGNARPRPARSAPRSFCTLCRLARAASLSRRRLGDVGTGRTRRRLRFGRSVRLGAILPALGRRAGAACSGPASRQHRADRPARPGARGRGAGQPDPHDRANGYCTSQLCADTQPIQCRFLATSNLSQSGLHSARLAAAACARCFHAKNRTRPGRRPCPALERTGSALPGASLAGRQAPPSTGWGAIRPTKAGTSRPRTTCARTGETSGEGSCHSSPSSRSSRLPTCRRRRRSWSCRPCGTPSTSPASKRWAQARPSSVPPARVPANSSKTASTALSSRMAAPNLWPPPLSAFWASMKQQALNCPAGRQTVLRELGPTEVCVQRLAAYEAVLRADAGQALPSDDWLRLACEPGQGFRTRIIGFPRPPAAKAPCRICRAEDLKQVGQMIVKYELGGLALLIPAYNAANTSLGYLHQFRNKHNPSMKSGCMTIAVPITLARLHVNSAQTLCVEMSIKVALMAKTSWPSKQTANGFTFMMQTTHCFRGLLPEHITGCDKTTLTLFCFLMKKGRKGRVPS